MMTQYSDDDMLLLSGIQHFAFCERQWALIYIEQMWEENVRTIEGKHLHERADDAFDNETRGSLRIVRSMPLISYRLGLMGIADVVEFYRDEEHIEGVNCRLSARRGFWRPVPVEYKRGRPKPDERDAVQLCAQAMALEEMMGISIDYGMIFYAQIKHREKIALSDSLRKRTEELSHKMHEIM